MDKEELARILEKIADLLELKGENPFKVRAYRNAAKAILGLEKSLEEIIREGKLLEIEGIGKSLADKIEQLASKGKLAFYEKLKKSLPRGLLDLMQVQGLGPKKVVLLYKKLKIQSLSGLKKACLKGQIAKLKGFGEKTEKNILDSLEHREEYQKRHLWWDGMEVATEILEGLKALKEASKAEIAGSLRRKMETVGDLDFVVGSSNPKPVMKWFTSQPMVEKVIAKGEKKASVKLKGGMEADIRIVPEHQFGFAFCYFTGSKEHTVKLRELSLKKSWSLSEYGFEGTKKGVVPKAFTRKEVSEEAIYKSLGLSFIPPELRENRGEFEAAAKSEIPSLITDADICGTLHNHTTSSDGRSTLKEMIQGAEKLKWEYLGISDHSKSSFQANGLSEERLLKQVEEIKKINASKEFSLYVFAGTECDILPNGALDFSEKTLAKLDYVIASVHSSLTQDEKTMTKRMIKAII